MRSKEMRAGGCIIGLHGLAESGKDTIYQMIYNIYEAQEIRNLFIDNLPIISKARGYAK